MQNVSNPTKPMLIRYSFKNWMSFRDEATFSMIASKERQHGERVPKIKKYQMRVLPIAAVYGGNASGKTNLCRALNFVRRFVLTGIAPKAGIPIRPFRLDKNSVSIPSSFCFEILAEECVYEFSFSATASIVTEEKLVRVLPSSEKTLYHREGGKLVECAIGDDPRLNFVFDGTRDNQLFLTNSVSQKLDFFRPVYDWFSNLILVGPDSRFKPFDQFLNESSPLYEKMNVMLRGMDTGIKHLGEETVPFDDIPIPSSLRDILIEELKDGETVHLQGNKGMSRFLLTRCGTEIVAKKLVSYHRSIGGEEVKFEINEESDGTRRVIDLLPAFLDFSRNESKKVYIIDEVDRSLHTLLTRKLIEAYLNGCSKSTQALLLITTHDALLMDQNLLRRDEMWVTERNDNGVSSLYSLCEFKDVRYDNDLRKSYLLGRFGGIPKILLTGAIGEG